MTYRHYNRPQMEHLDTTAERTALWRGLHLEEGTPPFVFADDWALQLVQPPIGWQQRPDMQFTKPIRTSMVGRARFVEDQVYKWLHKGIEQYVILGAGLYSFALRNTYPTEIIQVFEVDQPGTIHWKESRICELLGKCPAHLHLIPAFFEVASWKQALQQSSFQFTRPAVLTCTGVTLYLSQEACLQLLKDICTLKTGSIAIVSFYEPVSSLSGEDRLLLELSVKGAAASGTPMISFFTKQQVLDLASKASLKNC